MKKVCKKCKIVVKDAKCPICGGNQFTETWRGRIIVFNPDSVIGKKLKIKEKGEYAIKIK